MWEGSRVRQLNWSLCHRKRCYTKPVRRYHPQVLHLIKCTSSNAGLELTLKCSPTTILSTVFTLALSSAFHFFDPSRRMHQDRRKYSNRTACAPSSTLTPTFLFCPPCPMCVLLEAGCIGQSRCTSAHTDEKRCTELLQFISYLLSIG